MIPDEYAIIVDENDNIIEYRHRKHVDNFDRHRIVAIWLTNDKGEILVAKRAKTMKIQPSRWGPAAAGTVSHTETYKQTAYRELAEEIGLKDISLKEVGKFRVDEDRGEKRMCMVFTGVTDIAITDLKLQREEVEAAQFVDFETLCQEVANDSSKYVVNMDLLISTIQGRKHPALL